MSALAQAAAAFSRGDDAGTLAAAWRAAQAGERPGAPDLWRGRVQARRGFPDQARAALDAARAAGEGDDGLLGEVAAALLALGEAGRALACAFDAAAAGDGGATLAAVLAAPLVDPVAEVVGCAVAQLAQVSVPDASERAARAAAALRVQRRLPPPAALLAMAVVDPDPARAARCAQAAWASGLRDPGLAVGLLGRPLTARPPASEWPALLRAAAGWPCPG